jgi:hypothetical protein
MAYSLNIHLFSYNVAELYAVKVDKVGQNTLRLKYIT